MAHLQPQYATRSSEPSQQGHDQDRITSHAPSRYGSGTWENERFVSFGSFTPLQRNNRTRDNGLYENDPPSDYDHDPPYTQRRSTSHSHRDQFAAVRRPWSPETSEDDQSHDRYEADSTSSFTRRSCSHDDFYQQSSGERFRTATPHTYLPPCTQANADSSSPPQAPNPYSNQASQLTSSNLGRHDHHQRPTNGLGRLRRDARHKDRTSPPYNAIGYVRRDGQVYAEYAVYDTRRDSAL